MEKKNLIEKEVLELVFEKIKPSIMGIKNYNLFRTYRNRYQKGKLNQKAIKTLLEFFGYESECIYTYNPDKDKSRFKFN